MTRKMIIGSALMLFVIAMASRVSAEIAKPDKPTPLPPLRPSSPESPGKPGEVQLDWQGGGITSVIQTASIQKRIIFVYFYFDNAKEQFPANYDTKLQKYSQERAVFADIFVVTTKDKKGKVRIVDNFTASFFDKNKLPFSAIAFALDPYGNILDKMLPIITISKIMPFLDAAEKKFIGIQTDLDKRYDRAEKLLKEAELNSGKDKESDRIRIISESIKALQEIIKTGYEGYEATKKSYEKLDNLNERARQEYLALLKDYASLEKELQDPVNVVPELEKVMNTYKGLPVEQEIKDVINAVKKGEIPPLPKEPDKEEPKKSPPQEQPPEEQPPEKQSPPK